MKPDGGPAFPMADQYTQNGDPVCQGSCGMTLRDYFAAAVLPAIIADAGLEGLRENTGKQLASVALIAYGMADAMLAERAK